MRSVVVGLVGSLLALACGAAPPPQAVGQTANAPTPSTSSERAATPSAPVSATGIPAAPTGAAIDLHVFAFVSGSSVGTSVADGAALSDATSGQWTSPWREPGFSFTRLIPSWNAVTPDGSWITVEGRARRADGGETAWYSFGTWASGDGAVRRTTVNGQRDATARIAADTLIAVVPLTAYQLRFTLSRSAASVAAPVVRLAAAVASDDAGVRAAAPGTTGGRALDLGVPSYSQEIHAGEYPQYAGGGEAWCSPTSVAMVLDFWRRGPTATEFAWVDRRIADPQVVHAARQTYDAAYRGTGNWAFNTAYAATLGLRSFVTQLRSLAEAESFIAAGIPLVVSLTIPAGALPGFLFPQGSDGHLLVIRGFTPEGDVIANDPAALSNQAVRRVYPRLAFERTWIGGSGGVTYVMHPSEAPLPERPKGTTPNW